MRISTAHKVSAAMMGNMDLVEELNKAGGFHKYFKRTGAPGNFVYWYKHPITGKPVTGQQLAHEKKKREKAATKGASVGDKVFITTSRSQGGRGYDIKVTAVINKNEVRGIILSGSNVGMSVGGTITKKISLPTSTISAYVIQNLANVLFDAFSDPEWLSGSCASLAFGISEYLKTRKIPHVIKTNKDADHVWVEAGGKVLDGDKFGIQDTDTGYAIGKEVDYMKNPLEFTADYGIRLIPKEVRSVAKDLARYVELREKSASKETAPTTARHIEAEKMKGVEKIAVAKPGKELKHGLPSTGHLFTDKEKKYLHDVNISSGEKRIAVGDKIRITEARSHGRAISAGHDIKVTEVISKNKVRGVVLDGPHVGETTIGNPISSSRPAVEKIAVAKEKTAKPWHTDEAKKKEMASMLQRFVGEVKPEDVSTQGEAVAIYRRYMGDWKTTTGESYWLNTERNQRIKSRFKEWVALQSWYNAESMNAYIDVGEKGWLGFIIDYKKPLSQPQAKPQAIPVKVVEKKDTIKLSTGVEVPIVSKLSDSQVWNLYIKPEEEDMPDDIKQYLRDVKVEFGKRNIKLRPIISAMPDKGRKKVEEAPVKKDISKPIAFKGERIWFASSSAVEAYTAGALHKVEGDIAYIVKESAGKERIKVPVHLLEAAWRIKIGNIQGRTIGRLPADQLAKIKIK